MNYSGINPAKIGQYRKSVISGVMDSFSRVSMNGVINVSVQVSGFHRDVRYLIRHPRLQVHITWLWIQM